MPTIMGAMDGTPSTVDLPTRWRTRLLMVGVFAVAMAYVEAAVVVYLRDVYGIVDPLDPVLTEPAWVLPIEVGREAATLVMLLGAGWLTGWERWSRVGAFLAAFGIWDIAYYGWLWVLVRWPSSLLDWDLLFLIPAPWWAPVWAPVLAAALFVVAGTRVVAMAARGPRPRLDRRTVGVAAAGSVVALAAVFAPALAALPDGLQAMTEARPDRFAWPLYLLGWSLVAWAAWRALGFPVGAGAAANL